MAGLHAFRRVMMVVFFALVCLVPSGGQRRFADAAQPKRRGKGGKPETAGTGSKRGTGNERAGSSSRGQRADPCGPNADPDGEFSQPGLLCSARRLFWIPGSCCLHMQMAWPVIQLFACSEDLAACNISGATQICLRKALREARPETFRELLNASVALSPSSRTRCEAGRFMQRYVPGQHYRSPTQRLSQNLGCSVQVLARNKNHPEALKAAEVSPPLPPPEHCRPKQHSKAALNAFRSVPQRARALDPSSAEAVFLYASAKVRPYPPFSAARTRVQDPGRQGRETPDLHINI